MHFPPSHGRGRPEFHHTSRGRLCRRGQLPIVFGEFLSFPPQGKSPLEWCRFALLPFPEIFSTFSFRPLFVSIFRIKNFELYPSSRTQRCASDITFFFRRPALLVFQHPKRGWWVFCLNDDGSSTNYLSQTQLFKRYQESSKLKYSFMLSVPILYVIK